jgi:hypothetical protein
MTPPENPPNRRSPVADSTAGLPSLEQLLGAEPDEVAVLSVLAGRPTAGDPWGLVHATLLIVPEACGAVSWPEWELAQKRQRGPAPDPPLGPSFRTLGETWLAGRQVCSVAEADGWVERIWRTTAVDGPNLLPELGSIPTLEARLQKPRALARIFPDVDSPSSALISGFARPVEGVTLKSEASPALGLPDRLKIDGRWSFLPSRDLTGIHLTPPDVDPAIATSSSLLIGRGERRAWLRDARGDGKFEQFIVEVGWDPDQIDLADLELTHIERMDLDTVLATRIRLEDLDVDLVARAGSAAIGLPTLGRGVTHEVLLQTLDGELMDRSGPYPIIEQVQVTMVLDGETQPPIISGITESAPELEDRLERRDEVAAALRTVIESGAQARFLADRTVAVERLTGLLARARGELLVMDRYFGQDTADWRLLDPVGIPVRVLTGKLAKDGEGNLIEANPGADVTVRYRAKAPIHDRIYLWDGGGLSVGGSPTTFGLAPIRLSRLSQAEAVFWRAEFEALWSSKLFSQVF